MIKVWPEKSELLACDLSHIHRRHIRDKKYSILLGFPLDFFPTIHQYRYLEPKQAVISWLLSLSTKVLALCDLKLKQFSSDVRLMIQWTKNRVLLRCSALCKLRTLSLLAGTFLVLTGNAWVEHLRISTTEKGRRWSTFKELAVQWE